MHIILVGATGLVGAAVLDNMLAQEAITRITILSRRPVKMAEGLMRVKVIILSHFKSYGRRLLQELRDAQGCVWVMGVSQNDVDKEKYIEITALYPLVAVDAFNTLHPDKPFVFVYVSDEGATQSPGMFTPIFGRVKGQTESTFFNFFHKKNPNFKVYSVRPGAVDWTAHPEIHPFIPHQPAWKKVMMSLMNVVYKRMMTPTKPLGKVLTELAMSNGEPLTGSGTGMEGMVLTNEGIRRMSGLSGCGS